MHITVVESVCVEHESRTAAQRVSKVKEYILYSKGYLMRAEWGTGMESVENGKTVLFKKRERKWQNVSTPDYQNAFNVSGRVLEIGEREKDALPCFQSIE